ncbi:MAG: hypothetical protein IKA05_05745 [Clostridia bacterium]|nr:hypothetical protein [Clostridia bacterium]
MRKFKRAVLLLLIAALLLPSLCACADKQSQKVIGTCAGYDVLYEELRYVTLSYKDMFAATYGKEIWDTPESAEKYRAELEGVVWDMMLNNYAVLATCAYYMDASSINDSGIDEAVDAQVQEAMEESGGKSAFRDSLKEMYMTEHFLRFCLRVAQLENELLYVLCDDLGVIENDLDRFIAWLEDGNFRYVQHVFISNDPGDDVEENRATAEEIRRRLLEGEDISTFVGSAVNEDLQNAAPYFLVKDVYVDEMESAAFSMHFIGDVSRVVEVDTGFYVMVLLEHNESSLLLQASDLLTSYQWAKVEEEVETFRPKIELELNDYGKSIDLLAIQ